MKIRDNISMNRYAQEMRRIVIHNLNGFLPKEEFTRSGVGGSEK
jgi:hypothetical protein